MHEQHPLRRPRRESEFGGLLRAKTSTYLHLRWVGVDLQFRCNHSPRCARLLTAKLVLNWNDPSKILTVAPPFSGSTPGERPFTAKRLHLDLPNDILGLGARCRVSVARCKPCANLHNTNDPPRYLPTGLTPYVLSTT